MIDRWELIQAQALSKELRMKQNLQQWQQFSSDLNNIWVWLGETEEELEQLRCLDLSTDIQTIEFRIKKLKVGFQLEFVSRLSGLFICSDRINFISFHRCVPEGSRS